MDFHQKFSQDIRELSTPVANFWPVWFLLLFDIQASASSILFAPLIVRVTQLRFVASNFNLFSDYFRGNIYNDQVPPPSDFLLIFAMILVEDVWFFTMHRHSLFIRNRWVGLGQTKIERFIPSFCTKKFTSCTTNGLSQLLCRFSTHILLSTFWRF